MFPRSRGENPPKMKLVLFFDGPSSIKQCPAGAPGVWRLGLAIWRFELKAPTKHHTVDGWNPANQLRLVVYPIIYRVSAPSQVVVWEFSHQQYGQVWLVGGFNQPSWEIWSSNWILSPTSRGENAHLIPPPSALLNKSISQWFGSGRKPPGPASGQQLPTTESILSRTEVQGLVGLVGLPNRFPFWRDVTPKKNLSPCAFANVDSRWYFNTTFLGRTHADHEWPPGLRGERSESDEVL